MTHWSIQVAMGCGLTLSCGLMLGCGAPARSEGPMILEGASPKPELVAVERVEIERTRTGEIARAQLVHSLDAGVGAFLTTLEVQAHAPEGRFVGWELRRFDNEWVDLVPGDVVLAVNGMRIETPTQVQTLWKSLRNSQEIIVSATRQGQPLELRFAVRGEIQAESP